jgi:hypothetical protein
VSLREDQAVAALRRGPLVFDGTVVKSSDAPPSLKSRRDNVDKAMLREDYVRVRVDAIHHDVPVGLLRQGSEIWIAPLSTTHPDRILHATWYAAPLLGGEHLIVREVAHETVLRVTADVNRLVQRIDDDTLSERLKRADLVVLVTVKKVEQLASNAKFKSEHDPEMTVASVELKHVYKGDPPEALLEIGFSSSDDATWANAPKFAVGETWIVLLRREGDAKRFVLTDPADRRSREEQKRIEWLLKRGAAAK